MLHHLFMDTPSLSLLPSSLSRLPPSLSPSFPPSLLLSFFLYLSLSPSLLPSFSPSLPPSPSLLLSFLLSLSSQDISAHKSSRTTTAVPPQLGSSPSLLTYPLPPHEYAPHHQLYTMMRPGTISMAPQPIQPAKPCMTNEMGPPIFMPCECVNSLYICIHVYCTGYQCLLYICSVHRDIIFLSSFSLFHTQ